jgi:2-methylcitrate dehydratase PrpD
VASPAPYDVETQVDVQFSLPFVLSAAAHRIRAGADWQEHDTIRDPRIRAFMKKVRMHVDQNLVEIKRKDLRTWPARVEVRAKGTTYTAEALHMRGTDQTKHGFSDDELIAKFRHNASRQLTPARIDEAIERLWNAEKAATVSELTGTVAL